MGSGIDRHGALHSAARRHCKGDARQSVCTAPGVQHLPRGSLPRRNKGTRWKCYHPVPMLPARHEPRQDRRFPWIAWEGTQATTTGSPNEWHEWPTTFMIFLCCALVLPSVMQLPSDTARRSG